MKQDSVKLVAAVLSGLAFPGVAHAVSADSLLQQVADRYRGLKSYWFEGKVKMRMQTTGFNTEVEYPGILAVQKGDSIEPRKSYFKAGLAGNEMLEVSDGARTWHYVSQLKQYMEQEVSPRGAGTGGGTEDQEAKKAEAVADFDISRYENLPVRIKNPKFLRTGSVLFGKDTRKVTPCYLVEVEEKVGEPLQGTTVLPTTLYIDTASLLVLQEERQAVMKQYGQFDSMLVSSTFELNSVRLNEKLPDSLFAFRPPEGSKRVEEFEIPGYKRSKLKGKKAENFVLRNPEGEAVSLKDFKGKTVVLDFWASWCGPCRKAMPHLEKLHQEYKDRGLVILGINTESEDVAARFMTKNGYSFPTVIDADGKVQELYKVEAFPTVFVIGKDGKIKAHFFGAPQEKDLRQALAETGIK